MEKAERSIYLIDPQAQGEYVRQLLGLAIPAVLASILLTSALSLLLLTSGKAGLWFCVAILIFAVVFCLIVAGIFRRVGIRTSHRIHGPVYRIIQFLQAAAVKHGIPKDIRLRPSDQFHNLATTLNQFFNRLRDERDERIEWVRQTEQTLETMKESVDSLPDSTERSNVLSQLAEIQRSLNTTS